MNVASLETEAPVRIRFDHPATDEDLLRFCAEHESLRVERDANGELIVMSPTWSDTSNKNGYLTYQLFKWTDETNSGIAFESNAGFTLADSSIRSPDVAWISWKVWSALSPERREGFARICPQFVIELRSGTDRLSDVQEKMLMWMENGAELA